MRAVLVLLLFFAISLPAKCADRPALRRSSESEQKSKLSFRKANVAPPVTSQVLANSCMSTAQTAGATPFNAQIQILVTPAASLRSLRFTISPKPSSVTRRVSALYTVDYMQAHGYINSNTGVGNIPVFGLYSNYANTVTLTFDFGDGSPQTQVTTVTTPVFTEPCGYTTPTVLQARTNSTALSYDF